MTATENITGAIEAIVERISVLKTVRGKESYIDQILKKSKLLKPETISALHVVHGDLNLEEGSTYAARWRYKEANLSGDLAKDRFGKLGLIYVKEGNFGQASDAFQQAGLLVESREARLRHIEGWRIPVTFGDRVYGPLNMQSKLSELRLAYGQLGFQKEEAESRILDVVLSPSDDNKYTNAAMRALKRTNAAMLALQIDDSRAEDVVVAYLQQRSEDNQSLWHPRVNGLDGEASLVPYLAERIDPNTNEQLLLDLVDHGIANDTIGVATDLSDLLTGDARNVAKTCIGSAYIEDGSIERAANFLLTANITDADMWTALAEKAREKKDFKHAWLAYKTAGDEVNERGCALEHAFGLLGSNNLRAMEIYDEYLEPSEKDEHIAREYIMYITENYRSGLAMKTHELCEQAGIPKSEYVDVVLDDLKRLHDTIATGTYMLEHTDLPVEDNPLFGVADGYLEDPARYRSRESSLGELFGRAVEFYRKLGLDDEQIASRAIERTALNPTAVTGLRDARMFKEDHWKAYAMRAIEHDAQERDRHNWNLKDTIPLALAHAGYRNGSLDQQRLLAEAYESAGNGMEARRIWSKISTLEGQ